MEETRTTCAVEATNGSFSKGLAGKSNLFTFINYLSEKELMYSIKLRNLFERCTVVTRKRASSKADSETIRKASELVERGTLTTDEFLTHIAKMKSQKIVDFKQNTMLYVSTLCFIEC